MENRDLPAMPINAMEQVGELSITTNEHTGLTKREEILARFMAAMLSNPEMDYNYTTNGDGLAQDAMKFVDSYFSALEKELSK